MCTVSPIHYTFPRNRRNDAILAPRTKLAFDTALLVALYRFMLLWPTRFRRLQFCDTSPRLFRWYIYIHLSHQCCNGELAENNVQAIYALNAIIPTAPLAADPWEFATPPLCVYSHSSPLSVARFLHATLGHANLSVWTGIRPRFR